MAASEIKWKCMWIYFRNRNTNTVLNFETNVDMKMDT
jgi:hypothetical protein